MGKAFQAAGTTCAKALGQHRAWHVGGPVGRGVCVCLEQNEQGERGRGEGREGTGQWGEGSLGRALGATGREDFGADSVQCAGD